MAKRSYNQTCSTAFALDVIGERWTLLIVRELFPGPRRYSDLMNALTGIGTNLLAQRLKDLEQAGVIKQRKLPPPAGSTVYELTPLGSQLEEGFIALSKWGMNFAPVPPPEDAVFPIGSAIMVMRTVFSPRAAGKLDIRCEIHADGEVFRAYVQDGAIDVAYGPAENPDVVFSTRLDAFLRVFNEQLLPEEAIPSGEFCVESGDSQALVEFLKSFRLADFMDLAPRPD